MQRYDLPRLFRELEHDLFRFSAWCGKVGDAMKIVGPLLAVALVGVGGYLTRGLWFSVNVPLLALILTLIPYSIILVSRFRKPELEVGELTADDIGVSRCFHIRVKNKGPGNVRPTVTITRLTDQNGKPLPNVAESTQAKEVHWRGAPQPNWNPELKKGVPAFAGVFEVQDKDSTTPYLCTYPNEFNEPRRMWNEPILIKDQKALQLSLLISYGSSEDVKTYERHYVITPDRDAPLNYRIERVKRFVGSRAILTTSKPT